VDLFYQGGLNYMRYSVSDTAEYGDYVSGPRLIGEEVKYEMSQVLQEIQSGEFARRWIDENERGRPAFNEMRRRDQEHLIERVGAELRGMMPFVDPVVVKPGE
jgi:ketol-acid reductoisomerase